MLEYRPEIDGMRAVAVVPVILFHAGVGIFSGGFIGVDIFFVISGYLITSILISELSAQEYSILKAQFTNRMHGSAIAVARQARGEAFSS